MEKIHALVVNQDENIRQQLVEILNQIHITNKISQAKDGSQAVDILDKTKIGLIITDIPLGNLDGWRLARLVRSGILKTPSTTPIIAVSTIYSERIAEITAREYEINYFCTHENLDLLPGVINKFFSPEYNLTKASLLVIEDYQDNIDLIKRILGKQFDIETANNGESGLAAWQQRHHDLVLLDVMLPKMSGEQVLDKILTIDPDQAVVIMTAHGTAECAGSLILRGAVDFISKPFRAEQLRHICSIALRREDFMVSNEQYAQRTEKLQASEARFRRLVENLKEDHFFYTRDSQGNYTYISPSITNVLGYSTSDFIEHNSTYITNNPVNIKAENHEMLTLQGRQQPPYEKELQDSNGNAHHFEVNETPILQTGQVIAVDGIVHDITERIATQKQLRQLAESTFEAIVIHDKNIIMEANHIFSELTGVTYDDIIGENICDFFIENKNNLTPLYQTSDSDLPYELNIKNSNNTILPVEIRTRQIAYNGSPSTVTVIRDLTMQKQAEKNNEKIHAQLRQSQKMDAIGQLTGGIAHDFNNILASIMGYSELAIDKNSTNEDKKLSTYLDEVYSAAGRARDMIQQMLVFSRGNSITPTPLQLDPLINEAITMLRSTIPSSIDIVFKSENDLPPVLIDAVQLHQVIMNMCINARDAIPDSIGKISIELIHSAHTEGQCDSCHHDFSGDFITLSISDSGTGIDPLLISKIFDPFFSTKDIGKGTGMGLSMVHGIMHEHGGHIILNSSPENGTVFTLALPVHHGELAEPANEIKLAKLDRGSGHILVVDDDISLSHFLEELLQNYGYQVTVVNDPRKALELFEGKSIDIDLVITDQTMPYIPGDVLATTILEKNPNTPIILCTGYSERINEEKARRINISGFLTKPIDTTKLLGIIDNLLSQTKQNALTA